MEPNRDFKDLPFDLVGIGNAIVDVLVQSSDSFLEKNLLSKGNMMLIDQSQAENLYSLIGSGIESSGGSAANTIAGFSMLGGKAGFIGRTKNDQLGQIFVHDIRSTGAIFDTPSATNGPSTARCLIFVTPDAQRTMCTYLGASILFEPEDLNLSMLRNTKVLYLEGYLWDHPAAKRAFICAAKECKEAGGHVALSLSDSFCVNRHRESFLELTNNLIDILFANETEIKSLYQSNTLDSALTKIKDDCDIAAITLGEKGSVIITKENSIKISPYKFGKVIDTTGAGDLFASGFLYGYLKGKSLELCGKMGSICAGNIVTQMGSRSQYPLLDIVSKNIN